MWTDEFNRLKLMVVRSRRAALVNVAPRVLVFGVLVAYSALFDLDLG